MKRYFLLFVPFICVLFSACNLVNQPSKKDNSYWLSLISKDKNIKAAFAAMDSSSNIVKRHEALRGTAGYQDSSQIALSQFDELLTKAKTVDDVNSALGQIGYRNEVSALNATSKEFLNGISEFGKSHPEFRKLPKEQMQQILYEVYKQKGNAGQKAKKSSIFRKTQEKAPQMEKCLDDWANAIDDEDTAHGWVQVGISAALLFDEGICAVTCASSESPTCLDTCTDIALAKAAVTEGLEAARHISANIKVNCRGRACLAGTSSTACN